MSWRMHIAVVNTEKAQAIRARSADYYKNIIHDWEHVRKIAWDCCQTELKSGYVDNDITQAIINKVQDAGLVYDEQKLVKLINYISDGKISSIDYCDEDFTDFNNFVSNEMGVMEDYCLGRFDEISKTIGYPFYVDEEAQKMFEYYCPRVIHKKDLADIIELWRKMIVANYKEILLDPSKELRWRGHIEAKIDRWEFPYSEPYNMDEKQKEIVRAYDLEYRIFELVRLYKSIDWMRDTVIFFGW